MSLSLSLPLQFSLNFFISSHFMTFSLFGEGHPPPPPPSQKFEVLFFVVVLQKCAKTFLSSEKCLFVQIFLLSSVSLFPRTSTLLVNKRLSWLLPVLLIVNLQTLPHLLNINCRECISGYVDRNLAR